MSRETVQIGVRVDKKLWEAFRNDVQERKGTVRGHLKNEHERALQAYLRGSHGGDTHDRLTNIESELEAIRTTLSNPDKEKKNSSLSSRTEKRLREIHTTIAEETDDDVKVHEEVVELAIRKHAGSSEPTIRRYKQLLKQDEHVFQHPTNESMYFRDAKEFVLATNALRKGGKVTQEHYSEIVNSFGEEWWLTQQPESQDDSSGIDGGAFQ